MFGKLLYYFHGYKKTEFSYVFLPESANFINTFFCNICVFNLKFLEFTKAYEDIVSKLKAKSTSDVLLMGVP